MTTPRVKLGKDGVWYCRPYLGTSRATGKAIRPFRKFPEARDEKDAERMAEEWVSSLTAAGKVGVGQNLSEVLSVYVDGLEAFGHSPTTVDTYRSIISCYVDKFMPKADPAKITSWDVSSFERRLLSSGGQDGSPLSPNTVRKVHSFLSGAFRWMRSEGIVETSPLVDASKPRAERSDVTSLTEQEYALLSSAIESALSDDSTDQDAAHARIAAFSAFLGLRCGLRIGEVCALRESSVSFVAKTLRVSMTAAETRSKGLVAKRPKSDRSCRTIAVGEDVLSAVRKHEEWTRKLLESKGESPEKDAWLVTEDGSLMRPSTLRSWFSDMRDSAGVGRHATFHVLRHTHATFLIASGIDAKTVSERLGHADEATTLSLYAHVMPGRDRAAADVFSAL